jgi:DNA processing protein
MNTWPLVDLVALSLLKGITTADLMRLAAQHPDLQGALASLDADASLFGTPTEALREIAHDALHRAERIGVRVLTWSDAEMPRRVAHIPWPPALLWVRGNLPSITTPSVAVVGTRAATMQYGAPVTRSYVHAWVEAGCAIISGLAGGIDTVAHEATIDRNGCTVAVIASGIDRVTPTHARRLADRIVDHGGAVVSEYRCGQAALPPFFPQRNRIISALADAVCVMESDRRGGSLITADFARLHGRPLFALPGPVTSTRSAGTNALLRQQLAMAMDSADVVLDALGVQRLSLAADATPLTDLERRLLHVIEGGEVSVDVVAARCDVEASVAWSTLLQMELRGLVRQLPGGRVMAMVRT